MLDIQTIRQHPEEAAKALASRGVQIDAQRILKADDDRRRIQKELDDHRAEHKRESATNRRSSKAEQLKEEVEKFEQQLRAAEDAAGSLLIDLPNLPFPGVPVGSNPSANVVVREGGRKPKLAKPKNYLTIAKQLDLIDTEQAAVVSGSRFAYLKREAALIEFGLIQHALSTLTKEGFVPMIPPALVREEYIGKMGYLSRKDRDEVYVLEQDKLALIGTAEHAMGPYHAHQVLKPDDLPKRYVGFSPAFRREAGSYGKDTKGIFRVHQFDKVEMFVVCEPSSSSEELERLVKLQEKLVNELELPFRIVKLCTGELSHPSAMTYDLECWLPGQREGRGEYRETHSASNTTDFQSRTLSMAVKPREGKKYPPHTLNATAYAVGRTIIAILENYQEPDGSVRVPKRLVPYVGTDRISR